MVMKNKNQLRNSANEEKVDKFNQFLGINGGLSLFKEYNLSELYRLKTLYAEKKKLLKVKLMDLSGQHLEGKEELHFYRTTMKFILDFINQEICRLADEKRQIQKQNRNLLKSTKKVRDPSVSFDEEPLCKKEISLIGKIINREKNHNCSWDMLVSSYQKIIKNYSFIEMEEIIYEGIFGILESNLKSEEKYNYLISIYDYLNNRRKKLGKNGLEAEKEKLRNILGLIDRNLVSLKPEVITKKEELTNQIMDYLLKNPVPYYYIKRLFLLDPSFLQMRSDGYHISVLVLKHYIESQKEELRNHKNNYIPKEYYASFFELFFKNEISDMKEEDFVELTRLKEEFISYLKEHKYKEENKLDAMNKIGLLLENNKVSDLPFSDEVNSYLKELQYRNYSLFFDDKRVRLTENYVLMNQKKLDEFRTNFYEQYGMYPDENQVLETLSMKKVDYQNANSLLLFIPSSTPYCNFSVLQNSDGSSDFRIHVLDLTYYVQDGDVLDMELEENPLIDISKFLKSERVDEMPAITYQFKIHANHSVGPLKIYESIVPVLRDRLDYSNYREDKHAKKLVAIYRKLNDGGESEVTESSLENFFFQLLEQKLCHLASDKNLPIILKGRDSNLEEDIYRIQNGLGNLFGKMEKYTFKSFGSLFNQTLDEVHYTNEMCDKGDFSLSLMHPSNLIDLFNQRMFLKTEKFSRLSDSQKQNILEDFKMKSDSIVKVSNQQLGYIKDVGYEKVKAQKNKIRR